MPSAYPLPPTGPQYIRCQVIDKKYPAVLGPAYADGGQDSFVSTAAPSRIVWELEYAGLTQAEAALLDAHNDSCLDTHYSFNFTDPETGTTYVVKYLEFQRGTRAKRWLGKRLIRLIKRP